MKKLKHEISLTAGQAGELMAPIMEAVLTISPERAQYWIGRKKKLSAEIKGVLNGAGPSDYQDLISEWEKFYRDLGIDCDLSDVRIPDDPGSFGRVIIMAKGIAPQSAYDLCVQFFTCWKWTDKRLDEVIDFSFQSRSAKNSSYAIRIRDRVEADEELKNLSANQLKSMGIDGITLEERLVYELKYFKETGKHLDINNITLSTGSRDSDGDVPSVDWYSGKLRVYWYSLGRVYGGLRSRAAVS